MEPTFQSNGGDVMKLYGGIDLHSTNNYLGIYDEEDRAILSKRLPNDLAVVLENLEPYKAELAGIAVESTYNWYWLVDGLMEHGYRVLLTNPAGNEQYKGLKYTDDRHDSRWLARMLRLGIVATGYIYPKEERPIRDLLRKRVRLVQHRTAHIVSVLNTIARNTGSSLSWSKIESMSGDQISRLLGDELVGMAPRASLAVIKSLDQEITKIEKAVKAKAILRSEYKLLKTVWGVGTILGLTIMYETGEISRFPQVGDYCSYARCVESKRMSNGKKKGENNSKNGNRYLSWAFVEAANFATRFYPQAHRFVQRKRAKGNHTLAVKALGHKLARASYYVMRDQVEFDPRRLFG
jgi:transposase